MAPSSVRAQQALLHQLAPHTQALTQAPACAPRRQSTVTTLQRLRGLQYLWDHEAAAHLGLREVAVDRSTGGIIEFAADPINGIDWQRVQRQLEWRLTIRALMMTNPDAMRGTHGIPDWDPDDCWVPLGPRHQWQRFRPCDPVPGMPV